MIKRAEWISYLLGRVGSAGSGLCTGVLAILVSFSAISRYIFQRPVNFMEEVGGLLFIAIGFLGFAYAFNNRAHIRVTLIMNRFPKVVRRWADIVASALTLGYLIVFIKLSCDYVYLSYKIGCHTVDAHIYAVPWMSLMPLGMIFFAVSLLVFCIRKCHTSLSVQREEVTGREGEVIEKIG